MSCYTAFRFIVSFTTTSYFVNGTMGDIICEDYFYLCTSQDFGGIECRVSLSSEVLSIIPLKERHAKKKKILKIEDVIGCLCMKHQQIGNDVQTHTPEYPSSNLVSTFLNIYSYILSKSMKNSFSRKRNAILLRYCKHSLFDKNSIDVARWQSEIFSLIRPTISRVKDLDNQNSNESPRILVFVNPKSGTGSAEKVFNSRVRSLLGEANVSYDVVLTTSSGHCKKIVKETSDLRKYAGIVTVSGDGLPFEVYNGLLEREDWNISCQIPIGVIPQGSGNGLARSLAHFNREPYLNDPLVVSILNIVKLRSKEMDLCLAHIGPDATPICSFLSVGWGLMADIDIESERLRMIGEARFTVWAIARVLSLRTYRATLYYLPADRVLSTSFPILPQLNEPLPDSQEWIKESGEFVCLYSSMVPYISSDFCFAPESKLDDGLIWLMIIKAPVTKFQLIQLLLGMGDGSHTRLPWVTFLPVKAFRLLPEHTSAAHQSYLTIDGERFDSQVVQVEVIQRKGRVLCF